MAKDVSDMIAILRAATNLSDTQLRTEHNTKLGDRNHVLAKRKKLWGESGNAETASDQLAKLEILDHALKDMDAWYLPFVAERNAIRERESAGLMLLTTIRQAVLDRASAHRQLALAIEKGGRALRLERVREVADHLTATVTQLRGFLDNLSHLNDDKLAKAITGGIKTVKDLRELVETEGPMKPD